MNLFKFKTSNWVTDLALLLIRIGFGGMMIPAHGYKKLKNFEALKGEFYSFMGLSSSLSLSLAIFAELFCSILLILGFMTRLATIPLIITMLVAMNMLGWEIVGKNELPFLFFMAYIVIFLAGPGKYSVDYLIRKK
ncbi:MAG TPA: DoxX family protein [Chitinophagaceae bacterium]|nr:DoxX family protein [Chitinophagaceae bacterium]